MVDLVWEIWDSLVGWRSAGAAASVAPFSADIDPENIPAPVPNVFPQSVVLPLPLPLGGDAAQALIHATRSVTLAPGQAPVQIRSNPLLISLYRFF